MTLKNILTRASAMVPLLFMAACNTTASNDPTVTGSISQPISQAHIATGNAFQRGTASWYGPGFHGRRTASGERFNPQAMTAAHRTLPLGTRLRVTNKANGRSVVVRINDRGPFAKNRLIDLSLGAARELQMVRAGTAKVTLERLRIS